jgi:hypothetical protein
MFDSARRQVGMHGTVAGRARSMHAERLSGRAAM